MGHAVVSHCRAAVISGVVWLIEHRIVDASFGPGATGTHRIRNRVDWLLEATRSAICARTCVALSRSPTLSTCARASETKSNHISSLEPEDQDKQTTSMPEMILARTE